MKNSRQTFKTAGLLSAVYIILFIAERLYSPFFVLPAAMTVISIYVFITFKDLLNSKADYHSSNWVIWLIITFSILMFLWRITLPFVPAARALIRPAIIIPGFLYLILGITLFYCPDRLYGYLKPLAAAIILYGILHLTIVFAAYLMVFPIYIFFSVIFFKAYSEAGQQEAENSAAQESSIQG